MEHGSLAQEGGDCVFPEGSGQIPAALAEGLDVEHNTDMKEVRWRGGSVDVHDKAGKSFKGRKLLLTPSMG